MVFTKCLTRECLFSNKENFKDDKIHSGCSQVTENTSKKEKKRLCRNDGLCKTIDDFWGVGLRYW